MKLKSLLVASVLSIASTLSFASVDTSGLTADQIATLQDKVKEMKTQSPKTVSETARDEVSAWAELGAGMGKAVVAGAKEVGTAANDFAATPLGKITVAVVVYKILGDDILGVIYGSFALLLGASIGIWMIKSAKLKEYKVEPITILWGLATYNKKIVVKSGITTEDGMYVAVWGAVLIFISFVVSGLAIF